MFPKYILDYEVRTRHMQEKATKLQALVGSAASLRLEFSSWTNDVNAADKCVHLELYSEIYKYLLTNYIFKGVENLIF